MRAAHCLPALGLLLAMPAFAQGSRGLLTRLDEIGPAFQQCWSVPASLDGVKPADVTVRFALRADGSLLGEPRVTAANGLPEGTARTLLVASAIRAIKRCAPLALSAGLGGAIAGRVFTLRFRHSGTIEQGVSSRVRS